MPLSPDERVKYKALYLKTAHQYVQELQEKLTRLREGMTSSEIIDSLHRAAHSLRSQSEMMDFLSMSMVCSVIEKIFLGEKEQTMKLSPELLSKLSDAAKDLNESLDTIAETGSEKDLSQIALSLEESAQTVV